MGKILKKEEILLLIIIPIAGFFTCNEISLLIAPWILITASTVYANLHRGWRAAIKLFVAFVFIAIVRTLVPNPWLDFMSDKEKVFFIIKTSIPYIVWGVPYIIEALMGHKIKNSWLHLFFLPSLTALLEYLFILKGSSISSLSATQYDNILLAQIVSITGITGVVFMMQLLASFIADLVKANFDFSKKKKLIFVVTALFLLVTIYGSVRIGINAQSSETIRVAYSTIKATFDKDKQTEGTEWEAGIESAAASIASCDVIFWTEEAFEIDEKEEKEFIEDTNKIIKYNGINAYMPVKLNQEEGKFQNTIYYFDKNEGFKHRYTKNHPVPGVEKAYDTAEDKIYAEKINDSIVSDVICFDNFFDVWLRKKIDKKTDILLIPSWDPANTEAFTTPATMFRAIELGVNAIRHTEDGRVMAFDVNGRTISNIRNTKINRKAIYFMDMPAKGCDTIYKTFGDWFTIVCAIVSFISIIFCFVKKEEKL